MSRKTAATVTLLQHGHDIVSAYFVYPAQLQAQNPLTPKVPTEAAMDQQALDSIAQFCAEQQRSFDPEAWMGRTAIDGKGIAVVAKYLSMTSWYGHEAELEGIAARIADLGGFHREVQAIGLDLTRLSARLRHDIALRHRTGN